MNHLLSFSIIDWSGWGPNITSQEDWLPWSKNPVTPSGNNKITATTLPLALRRRCSHLNKMILEVSNQALKTHPIDYAVFCSQHGDLNQTITLLEEICEQTPLSPTRFSQSLHNTSAGLFSIINKLHQNITSLAAEKDTFLMGMLEAIAWLKLNPNKTVLFSIADEHIPEEYQSLNIKNNHKYAITLLLTTPKSNQTTLSLTLKNACDDPFDKELPQALEFLAWLLQSTNKNILTQRTKNQTFKWKKEEQ